MDIPEAKPCTVRKLYWYPVSEKPEPCVPVLLKLCGLSTWITVGCLCNDGTWHVQYTPAERAIPNITHWAYVKGPRNA